MQCEFFIFKFLTIIKNIYEYKYLVVWCLSTQNKFRDLGLLKNRIAIFVCQYTYRCSEKV